MKKMKPDIRSTSQHNLATNDIPFPLVRYLLALEELVFCPSSPVPDSMALYLKECSAPALLYAKYLVASGNLGREYPAVWKVGH